jgi:hypothetical protein
MRLRVTVNAAMRNATRACAAIFCGASMASLMIAMSNPTALHTDPLIVSRANRFRSGCGNAACLTRVRADGIIFSYYPIDFFGNVVSEKEQGIDTLRHLASRYIWWKTPDEAASMPARVIAQVMNLGDYDDVQMLAKHVGDAALRDVLTHAEAGQFNERSWAYWHYRLGLAAVGHVPPLPARRFA